MCGLTGIFSRSPITSHALSKSLDSVNYRGEDDRRLFTFTEDRARFFAAGNSATETKEKYPEAAGLAAENWLGFNRLSIVDRSEAGMQPFWDEASQTAFMLVGELYNYQELFQQYFSQHEQARFFSRTDTEVAFRLYLKLGAAFIHQLRGMFSIVVTDYAARKVHIYRDKIGMKPLFYTCTNRYFIVSSEIAGITGTGLIEKKPDKRGLAYLLYLESSPWESSVYQQVQPLPPGHSLTFDLQSWRFTKACYWHLAYQENAAAVSLDELEHDILETAKQHLAGDVPKGLSLSGGLDSGLLAYAFGKAAPEIKAYSINPADSDADESVFAALSAQHAGLAFQNIPIPESPGWHFLKAYFTSEDEPNTIPEPNTFLCRTIKNQGIKVLYNALGLDEIFGGYAYYSQVGRFQKIRKISRFLPVVPHEKTAGLKRFGLLYLPTMKRENLGWEAIKAMFPDESQSWQHPFEYQRDILLSVNPDFVNYPVLKQLSYWDLLYYVGAHHTYRADQSAMKATIEMRFPFLDAEFVTKYFQFSQIFRNIQTETKPVVRALARKLLPEKVNTMPKKGFTMPVKSWLAPHQQEVSEQLTALHKKGIIAPGFIEKYKANPYIQWQLCSLNQLF